MHVVARSNNVYGTTHVPRSKDVIVVMVGRYTRRCTRHARHARTHTHTHTTYIYAPWGVQWRVKSRQRDLALHRCHIRIVFKAKLPTQKKKKRTERNNRSQSDEMGKSSRRKRFAIFPPDCIFPSIFSGPARPSQSSGPQVTLNSSLDVNYIYIYIFLISIRACSCEVCMYIYIRLFLLVSFRHS